MAQLDSIQVPVTIVLSIVPARRAVKRAMDAVQDANRELARAEEVIESLRQDLQGYGIVLVLEEKEA
jgi:hypothetical protein